MNSNGNKISFLTALILVILSWLAIHFILEYDEYREKKEAIKQKGGISDD